MKLYFLIIVILSFYVIESQLAKVSPKVDFDTDEDGSDGDSDDDDSTGKNSSKQKVPPEIQGVRVVVDTTKIKKSIESRSGENDGENNSSNKDGGGSIKVGKKTVGIRTDITFEIDDIDDGDEVRSNTTITTTKNKKKESNGDVDDESDETVPIFRGTNNNNNNNDRRGGGGSGGGGGVRKWDTKNIPIFRGTNDDEIYRRGSGSAGGDNSGGNRDGNNNGGNTNFWSNHIPIPAVWTTERNYYPSYPDSVEQYKPVRPLTNNNNNNNNQWKPTCICTTQPASSWRSDDYGSRAYIIQESPPKITRVDDKLDYPFHSSDYKK